MQAKAATLLDQHKKQTRHASERKVLGEFAGLRRGSRCMLIECSVTPRTKECAFLLYICQICLHVHSLCVYGHHIYIYSCVWYRQREWSRVVQEMGEGRTWMFQQTKSDVINVVVA